MNDKTLSMVTLVALLAEPMAANAQSEFLEYIGAPLSNIQNSAQTPAPVPAFLSGTLILDRNLAPNMVDQLVIPASFSYSSPAGFLTSAFQAYEPFGSASFYFWTSSTGAITGWNIDLFSTSGPGSNTTLNEAASSVSLNGVGGDSFYTALSSPSCAVPPGVFNPCFSGGASNARVGSWSVKAAPEIDAGSAGSGLAFLLGTLMVLRGRRAIPLPPV